jgi:PAS domain S-box-containing protein
LILPPGNLAYTSSKMKINWRDYTRTRGVTDAAVEGSVRMTEYTRAEAALRESEANLKRAQQIANLGSWSMDYVNERLTVSDEVIRLFGGSPDDPASYESILSTVHPDDREAVDEVWNAALQTGTFDMDHRILVGNEVRWVRQKAEITFDEDGNATSADGILQDITERKRSEDKIRLLARLQTVVADLGVWALKSPSAAVLNRAVELVAQTLEVDCCAILESLPGGEELLLRAGAGCKADALGRATASRAGTQLGATLEAKEPVLVDDARTEARFVPLPRLLGDDGISAISVEIPTSEGAYGALGAYTRAWREFAGEEVHFLQSVAHVIGSSVERHRAEARLKRINQAHRALSACNEVLVRAAEESTLLQQVCRIVVDEAGYPLCWVGAAQHDRTKSIRVVARAGFDDTYLDSLNLSWAEHEEQGRGPMARCIRSQQPIVVKDIATDPQTLSWRAEALKRGYASTVAIPLRLDSVPFGALQIYSSEPQAFGAEEMKLLTELAEDLAFGIATLRRRVQQVRAEEEIRQLNAELEQRVVARTAELASARDRETALASRIQQMLLVEHPPDDFSGLRVAALALPSQQVDGDFYGFFRHAPWCMDLFVGDVMGKGTPAALLGAATKIILIQQLARLMTLARGDELPPTSAIVSGAHAGVVRELIELESFVTLCYGRFDLNRNVLEFVDCGHTGVIHFAASTGACSVLHGDNLPLGIREGERYVEVSALFDPGDVFILFSDGITEASNTNGELFGVGRLLECVRINRDRQPEDLVELIRSAVVQFSGSERMKDDLTCVAVKVVDARLPLARRELEIASDLGELRRVRTFVREVCGATTEQVDEGWIAELELAVNEAASNIMKHAHRDRAGQRILIEADVFPNHVAIRLHYLGHAFDPSKVVPFDPSTGAAALDNARESGFGLYLMSQTVDNVHYSRDERGRHCVSLSKAYT